MRRRAKLDPSAPAPEEVMLAEAIAGTRLAGLVCGALIGTGSRCNVHAARLEGRECALKIYKPRAIARHARRHAQPLAQYEYSMNRLYRARPALASHVAEPIDYLVTPRLQLFLQERLIGPLYYFWYQHASGADRERARAGIEALLEAAHSAGIYGLNLQALDLIVVADAAGEPIPKLFDFTDPARRAPHGWRLAALATRLGLITPKRQDDRALAQLHDFRALERRLRRSGI